MNEVSGSSTRIASTVLPGVTGIDTSPATVVNPVDGNVDNNNGGDVTATEGGAAGGSLSVWLLLSMAMLSLLRRRIA